MAGYSGTPLPRKLGIREGHRVAFSGAPAGFADALGELPDRVDIKTRARRPLDLVVAFFTHRRELERRFDGLAGAIFPDGAVGVMRRTNWQVGQRPRRSRRGVMR